MSQQAFWLFLKMDKRNLFVQMALQCAPVLAGIKVSNLLIIEERYWKGLCFLLRNSGLCARKLYCCRDKITLLLYRREELEQWLKTLQVEALLKELGYDSMELHRIFRKLEHRIGGHGNGEMPFPHELGLLLGYPAEDVRGFMGIGYKKCLYTGYWKVYEKAEENIALFSEYDRAMDLALSMAYERQNILKLKEVFEVNLLEGTYFFQKHDVYFESKIKSFEIIKNCFDEEDFLDIELENGHVGIGEYSKVAKIKRPSNIVKLFDWCFAIRNIDGEHIGYIGKPTKTE